MPPEITVAAVTESDGRFLVVEELIDDCVVFNQPAGHVEPGETLNAAVVREVREETAWRFEPSAWIGTYRWRNPKSGLITLRFTFCGTVDDHVATQALDAGIVAAHWLSRAELLARGPALRTPLVLRCIDDYLAGLRRPLDSVARLNLTNAAQIAAEFVC